MNNIDNPNTLKEAKGLNHVSAFHRLFSLPIEDTPVIPSQERQKLRISLLAEELEELKDALDTNNLVEVADACADLQYVLSGAILEFGLGGRFNEVFEEVHRSNMSKSCATYEEALATQKYYLDEKGTESEIVEKDNMFLVYRMSDKKVLKSVNYSPADIETIISGN